MHTPISRVVPVSLDWSQTSGPGSGGHTGGNMTYEPIPSLLAEIDRKLNAILAALSPAETAQGAAKGGFKGAMTPQRARHRKASVGLSLPT